MSVLIMTSQGYPTIYSASNTKAEFISLALKRKDIDVTIVDVPYGTPNVLKTIKSKSDKDIDYIQLPKQSGKLKSVILNMPKIIRILRDNKKLNQKNILVVSFIFFPIYLLLCFIAKLYGYKIVLVYHEWNIATKHFSILSTIEDYFSTFTFGFFLDGILPISHFLYNKCKFFHKKMMILPIIADFKRNIIKMNDNTHYTFCANVEYLLRNTLILDAFDMFWKEHQNVNLFLVLSGNSISINELRDKLNNYACQNYIKIKTNMPQLDLYELYDSSIGLLIPLDPNSTADKARFSQKIAEYLTSQRPIITNNVGEIKYYFQDHENVLLTDYSAEGFSNALSSLYNNSDLATKIGANGHIIGEKYFGIDSNGNKLLKFFEQL